MNTVVDIQPWSYGLMPEHGFHIFVGRRGRGKTTFARYTAMYDRNRDTGMFVVMVGSNKVRASWSDIVPRLFIVDISLSYLERMFREQDARIAAYDDMGRTLPKKYHITLILDDVGSTGTFMRSKIMRHLASKGRQAYFTVYLLLQKLLQAPTDVRSQADCVFALATSSKKNITALHSEFCSGVPLREFRAVMSSATENFRSLVIMNGAGSDDISKVCYCASISPYPPKWYKVGSDEQWAYSKSHYLDLDRLRRRARDNERKLVAADESDEDEKCDDDGVNIYDVLDNKRVYEDRAGKLIVRRVMSMSSAPMDANQVSEGRPTKETKEKKE